MDIDKVKNCHRIKSLDYLRGFFTIYIVVHHLSLFTYHKVFYFITGQGQFVVILFLIMSGISQELSYKAFSNINFFDFLKKIFLRIYPLFLLSMLLAFGLCLLEGNGAVNFKSKDIWGHLLNIQDLENRYPGIWVSTFLSNTPLWYVSYVWWSYLVFFFCKKIKEDRQLYCAFSISLFGFFSFHLFPNTLSHILSYFLIFWSGVELMKIYEKEQLLTLKKFQKTLSAVGLMVIVSLIPLILFQEKLMLAYYPVIEFRHYLYCFAGLILSIWWVSNGKPYIQFFRFFDKISLISYALFLFHYPLMIAHNPFHFSNIWVNYLSGFILALLLSFLANNLTNRLPSYLNRQN